MNVLHCTEIMRQKSETKVLTTPVKGENLSALLIEAQPAATYQTEPGHTRLAMKPRHDLLDTYLSSLLN
jgi:hypothetical protein